MYNAVAIYGLCCELVSAKALGLDPPCLQTAGATSRALVSAVLELPWQQTVIFAAALAWCSTCLCLPGLERWLLLVGGGLVRAGF